MNILLNLFQILFEFLPYFIFYSVASQKFKMKEILLQIQITAIIVSSCFVAMKITVSVLQS